MTEESLEGVPEATPEGYPEVYPEALSEKLPKEDSEKLPRVDPFGIVSAASSEPPYRSQNPLSPTSSLGRKDSGVPVAASTSEVARARSASA